MSADASAEVPARRNAGARARLAVAVVVGAIVVAASVAVTWRAGHSAGAAPRPVTDEQVAAECLRSLSELNPESFSDPVQRIVVRNGASQIRVYVSEPDNWISVCRSGRDGHEQTFGTIMEQGPADRIRLFGGEDAVLKPKLLLGRLPTGATRIEARLSSGRTLTGAHDGDIFVVSAPDSSVAGARLTALRPDGSVIATAVAPNDGT